MDKKNGKRILRAGNMLNPAPVVMVSCGSSIDEYNIINIAWTAFTDNVVNCDIVSLFKSVN